MRKLALFVAICCIGVGLYFGFIHKPPERQSVRILPGIQFAFTRDENAADYYAKACETMSRRAADDRDIDFLTSEERDWFMLGTSCRRSSWHPEHRPHIVDPMDSTAYLRYLRGLGRMMAQEGRTAERAGDLQKAMGIWRRVAVLGWHTEREQECFLQVLVGTAIETIAYNEFIRCYRERGDTKLADRYEGFKQRLRDRTDEFRKVIGPESPQDYRRIKAIALSHDSPMWRKEACIALVYYWSTVDGSVRQDAVAAMTTVSRQDTNPVVRDAARNAIAYMLGRKAIPPGLFGERPRR